MTGFDGLIEARARQVSDLVRRSGSRLVAGTGRSERETTLGEKALGVLGVGEEVVTRAIGSLVGSNPKYSFRGGVGHYENQVGFADLFRDTGMDPVTSSILGIAAAIANPLDPLNKLKILGATKLGKAAEGIEAAGKNLVKDTDGLWRISAAKVTEDIASREKALAAGQYHPAEAQAAQRSINASKESLKHTEELNSLLEELQHRGVDVNELRLAGSTYDQVRLGQRQLVGFSSPMNLSHIPGLGGGVRDASVYGLSGPKTAALVKATTSLKDNLIVKPLSDAAYKMADYIGIPTARTARSKKLGSDIKHILDNSKGNVEAVERDMQSTLIQFMKDYGPQGKDAAKADAHTVIQSLELKHTGTKEMAIAELDKLKDYIPSLPRGKGAIIEGGGGLSNEQKLRLTQSGVEDKEIPIAVGAFDKANPQNIFVGDHKQHEVKLLGRYVVIKTSDAKIASDKTLLDELNGIYGNRVWAKHDRGTKYPSHEIERKLNPEARVKITKCEEGKCFSNTNKLASEIDGSVVHGTVERNGKRFEHAWVEKDGYVYDPTAGVKTTKEDYYAEVNPLVNAIYPWDKALVKSIREGHSGPFLSETFLIQKRHPGARRIVTTDDFEPAHLRNLESIAAQISNDKKTFTNLKPEDILVSPSGAVQIINPSVITTSKSQAEAVANSREAIDALAEKLGVPKGSTREYPSLKNTTTARSVPRGVDGLTFRNLDSTSDIPEGMTVTMNAHDLLEQAVNTDGFKQYVRASYDQIEPQEVAKLVGEGKDFERANNIEFHRQEIRRAIDQGLTPQIEPITLVKDDFGNMHIFNGHDRLTAAILEGYEGVPVYRRNFIGDVRTADNGFYVGKTMRLVDVWNPTENSSALNLVEGTRGIVAGNYSLIPRGGETIKLGADSLVVQPELSSLLNRIVILGPQFVGKARTQRIESMLSMLTENFGSVRNALIRLSELSEKAPDIKSFATSLEGLLVNAQTKQGIKLDNVFRHPDAENLLGKFREAATKTLDDLASNGVLTTTTIKDPRRVMLASDASDLVVQVMDIEKNTLRLFGNQTTTAHLKTVAEDFLNRTATAADIEPYARIELNGIDGTKRLEAKDFVDGTHPLITEVLEPTKVFSISAEQSKALRSEGVFVADAKNTDKVRKQMEERGLNFGVLLKEQERTVKSTKTGQYIPGQKETVIIRPEFTFFVTRSGSVVIGTKTRNVEDLLKTVFEEGPRYFEEFGVMTTGKIVMSNPFGAKMEKIGVGEMRNLEDRLKELAGRFKELGFSESTVLQVHVPFDDAVWRAMYGERVTMGDILKDKFKLTIPEGLKGMTPDIRVLAPGRLGADAAETGIVAIERTRLANEKMQNLFTKLEDIGDKAFLDQAKAGIPISYYSSWFGRNTALRVKEALNEAWLKFPDKESKTFKYLESQLQGRVITDLTTQEFNTVIKRLQKEGVEHPESIIADVVKSFRDGYKLTPTKVMASTLVALSKVVPEGLDFFHLDPFWSTALSVRKAEKAISRKQIVDAIKENGVTVWHGSVGELNGIKIGKNKKFLKLESDIVDYNNQLTEAQASLEQLSNATPDLKTTTKQAELKQKIDELTEKLRDAGERKAVFTEKIGKGKVLDTMVDLESEQVWIRGEDLTRLIDDGLVKPSDVLGDPSDAFVRVPIKKYASILDKDNAEVFLFPKEIAGVVQKYFGTTTKDGFGKFLSLWDSVQSLWRSWTLFPIPAYHTRNFISNMFMAYLGGVTDPGVYRDAMSMFKIIDGHRKGALSIKQVREALGAISFPSASGQVVTGQQMWDAFSHSGGLAGGLNYNEFNAFGSVVRESQFSKLSVEAGLRPSSELAGSWLFDNSALRLGVSAAAFVENRFRLATFIDSIVKGHVEVKGGEVIAGFEAASMRMKSVFYDYSDLSAFERSWLRRVIPFYSWSRHNVPRMLTTLMTEPIKHYRMAEFFHQIEVGATDGEPPGENDIPDWIKGKFGLIVDKTPQGNYIIKTGDGFLPMIDAYKVLSGTGLVNMVKDGITPFFKYPVEQLTNYSFYSGKEIEAVPGQVSSSFSLGELGFSRRSTTQGPLGVLNILLNDSLFKTFFRPGNELTSKVIDPIFDGKEGPSLKLGVYALMLGKAYEVNPQQARMAVFRNWSSRQRQLEGLRNDAEQQGDVASVEGANRMLTWLRLQYPGERER